MVSQIEKRSRVAKIIKRNENNNSIRDENYFY